MRQLLLVPAITLAMWVFGPTATPPAMPALVPVHAITVDGRPYLQYDPSGDGRVVAYAGDVWHASRIAILVPGVDTTLRNFDTGLGGVQRRAPRFQMQQLYDQLRATDPLYDVAVVAWLGYDAPEGVGRAAVREDRAAAGAAALKSFVDSVLLANPSTRITVVGHSYGSIVAGLAAPVLDHRVVNIIALGSPGMGVDDIRGLRTTANVYAGTAPSDWTRWIPGVRVFGIGHGTRPTEPSFGARPLPTGGVDGHDGYFVSGTESLRAMAGITLGEDTQWTSQ